MGGKHDPTIDKNPESLKLARTTALFSDFIPLQRLSDSTTGITEKDEKT